MFDKLEITSEYAQALLLAILPYVSDFAQRVGLDIPLPITTNHVARFIPSRDPENVGGSLTLTNGFVFAYQHGHVQRFSSGSLADPDSVVPEARFCPVARQPLVRPFIAGGPEGGARWGLNPGTAANCWSFAISPNGSITIGRHGSRPPTSAPREWPLSEPLPGNWGINVSFADGHAELVKLPDLWQLTWSRTWFDEPQPTRRAGGR